jgi:hypothetical protein
VSIYLDLEVHGPWPVRSVLGLTRTRHRFVDQLDYIIELINVGDRLAVSPNNAPEDAQLRRQPSRPNREAAQAHSNLKNGRATHENGRKRRLQQGAGCSTVRALLLSSSHSPF